jgi:hypothetical protein
MPTSPFLEGLSGRVRMPAPAATRSRRVFDGLRARVFFFVGRTLDASRAIAPPRPPFFWFFGLRPTGGLLLRCLVLMGIGFLRWLVVAEWRRDTRAMCLRSREAPCSSCAVPESCWSRRVVGKICRNAHLDDLPPTHKTARTAL